jgi:Spy/CpxP family protein refolding chaperone
MILKSSLVVLALAVAGTAFAQIPDKSSSPDQTGPHPHGQWKGHRGGPNPEFETKMLTKRLSLTPEQVAQVEPILSASHEQMKALKPAAGATPDFKAMHEQRKAIMTETQQKLDAVLTPEQKEKLHSHEFHGGGPRGNWNHQPASPSGA